MFIETRNFLCYVNQINFQKHQNVLFLVYYYVSKVFSPRADFLRPILAGEHKFVMSQHLLIALPSFIQNEELVPVLHCPKMNVLLFVRICVMKTAGFVQGMQGLVIFEAGDF